MFMHQNKADYSFNYYHPTEEIESIEHKKKEQFNPYVNNEGSVMAIAGKNFVIAAGDKRLSNGYSIVSRDSSKLCKLTDNVILASSGMYADMMALQKYLKARIEIYRSTNRQEPSLTSVAQMLSVTLYQRRFFPYYTFNCLCGKNDDGKFICYGYDAIGSYQTFQAGAQGSGAQLITPVLDNVIDRNPNLTEEQAKKLVLETMNGTSCRDIYTGDKVELFILRENGEFITEEYPLRDD